MKTIHLLPLIFSSLFCFTLQAQDEKPKAIRKVKISDFSGFYAESTEPMKRGTISDFKSLAPQCEVWNNDFSTFALWNNSNYTFVNSYSAFVGLSFYNKQKKSYRKNVSLRLGLNHSAKGIDLMSSYMKSNYDPSNYDPTDTNITEYYTLSNSSEKIQLDASFIYKFIPNSRFSFYTGLAINPGLRYYVSTMITHSRDTYYLDETEPYFTYRSTSTMGYGSQNKSSFLFSSYVPVGIDFRLGKKDAFLRMFHFFAEARPTVKITTIPELKSITSAYMNYGWGIKISRE